MLTKISIPSMTGLFLHAKFRVHCVHHHSDSTLVMHKYCGKKWQHWGNQTAIWDGESDGPKEWCIRRESSCLEGK